jgi:hypothetical protein
MEPQKRGGVMVGLSLMAMIGCVGPVDDRTHGSATSSETTNTPAPTVTVGQKKLAIVTRADGLQELKLNGHFMHRIVVKREHDGGVHRQCASAAASEGAEQ